MKRTSLYILINFCLLVYASATTRAQTNASLSIGQSAIDFTLKDLNGQPHSLKDYRGKIGLVVFLSAECPFSNAYYDRLLAIANDYAKQNVVLIGINSSPAESLDEIREHAKKHKLDFTILKDAGSRIADAYGATRTPEVFVVNPAGVLSYHGRIDNAKDPARVQRNDLRVALDEILAGKAVSVPETKSFGCPIKMARRNNSASSNQRMTPSNAEMRISLNTGNPASSNFPIANSFVPQKKSAAKPAVGGKNGSSGPVPKVTLLKPAEFAGIIESVRGQSLVINFWATWCGPCVVEFPEFVALDAKYRDKGVKIIGISADEVTDLKTKVIAFLKEKKARFDNYVQDADDPQEIFDVIDKDWPGTLPATFVFDKKGAITYKHYGIIDRDELVAAIENTLK